MAISARHFARLGAVQFLYSWDIQKDSLETVDDRQCLIDKDVFLRGDLKYFKTLLEKIPPKVPLIDEAIAAAARRELSEIDAVALAILRLGAYEMLYRPDVPFRVVANECIELSRDFGNLDSYRFINGTLDKLASRLKSDHDSSADDADVPASSGESRIINEYFLRHSAAFSDTVVAGIGDDAAVLRVPTGMQLVISSDTSAEDVHFPAGAAPDDIGYRALAVAMSDIAAMGARPTHAMLNLAVPQFAAAWLRQFSAGFFELMDRYEMSLIGGDTVKGPLNIGVTVFGLVESNAFLTRHGAQAEDGIYVTGTLGDAGLGLQKIHARLSKNSSLHFFRNRYLRPAPRIEAGLALAAQASAAIDVSDGLIADLGHILTASSVGADLYLEQLPLSDPYRRQLDKIGWNFALTHGDDYELCFTLPPGNEDAVNKLSRQLGLPIQRIGTISNQSGLRIYDAADQLVNISHTGFSHLSD